MASCELFVPCGLTWTHADFTYLSDVFPFIFSSSSVRSLVLCVILTTLIRAYSLHIYSLLETYIFFSAVSSRCCRYITSLVLVFRLYANILAKVRECSARATLLSVHDIKLQQGARTICNVFHAHHVYITRLPGLLDYSTFPPLILPSGPP
jgi:hypothetical protein